MGTVGSLSRTSSAVDPAAVLDVVTKQYTDNRTLSMVVNAKTDYGAKGDGSTDDTTALNNAKAQAVTLGVPLYIPAGTYKITSMLNWVQDGLVAFGAGVFKTLIKQYTNNTAIVRVGGQSQHISDLRFAYATAQTSSNTASNGIEFLLTFMSTFERLSVEACAVGLMLPTGLGTNNCFSCSFSDIRVNGFAISALDFQSTSSFSTGNVFENLYFQNNYSGSTVGCTGPMVRFSSCDEMTVHQMNIEWCNPANDAVTLYQCRNAVMSAVHFEQLNPTGAGLGFFRLYDSCKLVLNGLTFSHNTIGNSLGTFSAFRIGGNNNYVKCVGLSLNTNTVSVTGTTNTLVGFDTAQTGTVVDIQNADLGDYAVQVANESTPTSVKRVNNSYPHTHAESDTTSLSADLAARALTARLITAGTGLTGGGDLTADRTLTVAYGTTSTTAAVGNDTRLSDSRTPLTHTHAESDTTNLTTDLAAKAPLASPTFTGTVTTARLVSTPTTLTFAATITPDATLGNSIKVTATAAMTIAVPTGGTDGQTLVVEVLASGANRVVTLNASILLTTGQAVTYTIVSGKVGVFAFRFSALAGSVWLCTSMTQAL